MAAIHYLRALFPAAAGLYACGIIVLVFYGRTLEGMVRPWVPESQDAIIFWALVVSPVALGAFTRTLQNSNHLLTLIFERTAPESTTSRRLTQVSALVLMGAMLRVTIVMPINIAEFSHFPIYAGQAALIYCALSYRLSRHPLVRAGLTLMLTNTVSVCDEVAQYFHPTRFFDLRDLTLNLVGSLWGLLLSHSGKVPAHTHALKGQARA